MFNLVSVPYVIYDRKKKKKVIKTKNKSIIFAWLWDGRKAHKYFRKCTYIIIKIVILLAYFMENFVRRAKQI